MQGNVASRARIIFHQSERKEEHARTADGQNPVRVDVRQGRGLSLNAGIKPGESLPLRFVHAESRMGKLLRQTIERSFELRIARSDVVRQSHLVKLRAPRDDGRHERSSHARTDVACEIHQSRDSIALFLLHTDVGSSGGGNKYEAQRQILKDAEPSGVRETHLLVPPSDGNVHADGQHEPAASNQVAELEF